MNDPDSYDSLSDYQRRDALDLIPYIVSQMSWKRSERILDFGCGSGYNTRHVLLPALSKCLEDESREIYAVDISPQMIQFAVTKYEHPQITYRVLDIEREGDKDLGLTFDKIFSFHVFHWISDVEKLMVALHKLLKPDGEIAFYFLCGGSIFSVYDAMSKCPKWSSYTTDVRKYIPKTFYSDDPGDDIRKLMTAKGFHIYESALVPRKFWYPNIESFLGSAMAANPFYPRIPEKLRLEFKEDFRKAFVPFLKFCPTTESPLAVEGPAQVMLVRGKKL